MALQERLHIGAAPLRYRLDLGDHSASTGNEDSLAFVLYRISNSAKFLAASVALISVMKSDYQIFGVGDPT